MILLTLVVLLFDYLLCNHDCIVMKHVSFEAYESGDNLCSCTVRGSMVFDI